MITSFANLVSSIESDFANNVASLLGTDVFYANGPAEPSSPTSASALVSVLLGETTQVDFGHTKRHRTPGVLHVRFRFALESGKSTAMFDADTIAARYRSVTRSGIVFKSPSIEMGSRQDSWWTLIVKCPFYADLIA